MVDENKTALSDQLHTMIEQLDTLDPGSKEQASLSSQIAMLIKVDTEDTKVEQEKDNEAYRRGFESERIELDKNKLEFEYEKLEFEKEKLNAATELEKLKHEQQVQIDRLKAEYELEREKYRIQEEQKIELARLDNEVKKARQALILGCLGIVVDTGARIGVPIMKKDANFELQRRACLFETEGRGFTMKGSKAWEMEKI